MPDQTLTNPTEEEERRVMLESPRERPSGRFKWIIVVAVLAVVAVLVPLYLYYSVRESTDDAQIEGHIHPIGARVGGTITQVNVDNNQYVEAGALLLQIDPRDYQTALAKAQGDLSEQEALWHASQADIPVTSGTTASQLSGTEAEVQEAQAGLAAAQKDAQAAEAKRTVAEAGLREASANSERASKDLERMKSLIAKEEISQQQYDAAVASAASLSAAQDAARAAVADAEAGVEAANSRIALAQAHLAQSEAEVEGARTAPQQVASIRAHADSARAKWEEAKASADQAHLNLEYTTVRAPISGIISKKSVEVGQTVQPGQSLLAIVPLNDIWVTANFKETQLRDMRVGQPAVISVDAYGGRKYQGHVDSIAAATGAQFSLLPPENATGNYVKVVQRVPVKIVLENGQDAEHLLRPGMSVEPTVRIR